MSSPEAMALAALWSRLFFQWMWNRRTNTFTAKGKSSPLLQHAIETFDGYLTKGFSSGIIERALREGKDRGDKGFIVSLMKEVKPIEAKESLIKGDQDYTHAELIKDGQLRMDYSIADLRHYYHQQLGKVAYVSTLVELIDEMGLDLLLFCIDEAHYAEDIELRSPYGLRLFLDAAKHRREVQLDLRRGLMLAGERRNY